MNDPNLENALLLLDSGELSPEEAKVLTARLDSDPEAKAALAEIQLLQDAGRAASREKVPPLSDLQKERLRAAIPSRNRIPAVLALAAALVIAVFFLPALLPSSSESTLVSVPVTTPVADPDQEEIWSELDDLEQELAVWKDTPVSDLLFVEDEDYWAEQLLLSGESI